MKKRHRPFLLVLLMGLPLAALFRSGGRLPAFASFPDPPLYLDLNRATAFQLSLLPGLGPARSARIVEVRRTGGPFKSLEDLERRVPGLGPALVSRLAPFVKNLPRKGGKGR